MAFFHSLDFKKTGGFRFGKAAGQDKIENQIWKRSIFQEAAGRVGETVGGISLGCTG